MKFLAIDTVAKYLTVVAYADGRREQIFLPDCAMKHSVLLMDAVRETLSRARLTPKDCDFFAAVVGPGSFTGIRIGISTVKGLCLAAEKPALSLTSFDTIAYAERKPLLALADAGHGCFYSCAFDGNGSAVRPQAFRSREEIDAIIEEGFPPVAAEPLFPGCGVADPAEGLFRFCCERGASAADPALLSALYLRKSSAEENRK